MLQVSTLGTACIAAGDLHVQPSSSRTFGTLLYLASEPGRRVPRATLQSLIFPDMSDRSGSHSLRQLVYKARQLGAPIESDNGNVWVGADQVWTDYSEIIASDRLNSQQFASIEAGFLPGYLPEHKGAFVEWLDGYRVRTTLEIRRRVLRDLARARVVGDWQMVERAARACLALDPLNEEGTLGLAEAIACSGSKAAGVRLLDDYLEDIGSASPDLRLPATVLRRRISERIPDRPYQSPTDLPFVGREAEMAFLAERFQHARRGESQCVVISGEPGIGKTRLAAEFANVAALDGARIERVAAQSHDVHRPMGAFIELVPRLLQLPGALGSSPQSMAALRRLTSHDPNSERDRPETALDAESVFYGITRAISDLIDAIAAEATLVVVVEDAQWLDRLSLRVIGDLVLGRNPRRLLVVLTSRDANVFEDGARYYDGGTRLALHGIDPRVVEQLINNLVGERVTNSNGSLAGWMATVASGNPLFVAALTTHYLETGEQFSVPPTLRALMTKRLATIDRRTFAVLQMCAVLGKYCTVSRLIVALGMTTIELLEAVQEAQKARLLTLNTVSVTIAHALMAEAVIEQSAQLALRVAHRTAAEVLASEMSRSPDELWELAEHWMAAADTERALAAFRMCAHHALEIGRPREAALALNRALQLPLPDSTRAAVGRELLVAATTGSDYELATRGIVAWRSVSSEIEHDTEELAELRTNAICGAEMTSTIMRLLKCVGCHGAVARHRIQAGALIMMLAEGARDLELPERARELLSDALTSSGDDENTSEFLMIYHAVFGNLDRAASNARRLCRIAESWSASAAARANMNASRVLWLAGHIDESTACIELAYANGERAGLPRLCLTIAAALVCRCLDLDEGGPQRARVWLRRANEVLAVWPDGEFRPEYVDARLHLAICCGDPTNAELVRMSEGLPQNLIQRRALDATRLRIRQLTGDRALQDLALEPIVTGATTLPRHEASDLEMAVALYAMRERGNSRAAREQLESYMTKSRLIRAPLDYTLRQLADGVD